MVMKGYVLLSNGGLSLPAQKAALHRLGVDQAPSSGQLFVDDARERATLARRIGDELYARRLAVNSLVAGDALAIASPACLGMSVNDIRLTLDEILGRHIDIIVANPRLHVRAGDRQGVAGFLDAAFKERRAAHAGWMRQARVSPTLKGGRRRIDFDEALARKLWSDPAYTKEDVAVAVGVGVRTLHRRLGSRNLRPPA